MCWIILTLECVCSVAHLFSTLCNFMNYSPPGSCPWNFLGKNTRVDCYFLLEGIFPNQGLNSCLFQDPVNFSPPGIHTMFRYLRLKALKKSTHQNINSATDRMVVFWVFYFLLYTVQNFLKFLWPGYISFSSEKKIH